MIELLVSFFCNFTGFGYADVENKILTTPSHVMRIASISKPLAMTAAARYLGRYFSIIV